MTENFWLACLVPKLCRGAISRGKLRFVAYANVGIDRATLNNLKQLSLLQRETIGQKREVCFVLLKIICRGIMLKETELKF